MAKTSCYSERPTYRWAAGLAISTAFVLFWLTASVGIIGDGPVNLLYLGVLAVGTGGAFFARFRPRGLALTGVVTAVTQLAIPVIALTIWNAGAIEWLTDPTSPHPPFHPGIKPVFVLNAAFVVTWLLAAWMFWKSREDLGAQ